MFNVPGKQQFIGAILRVISRWKCTAGRYLILFPRRKFCAPATDDSRKDSRFAALPRRGCLRRRFMDS